MSITLRTSAIAAAMSAAAPAALAQQNADFEDVVGSFIAGDMFVTQGVDVTVGPLVTSGFTTSNVVGILGPNEDRTGPVGTPSNEARVNNVTLAFEFDRVYTDLTFDYEDLGGLNTISINGDKREYANTTAFFNTDPVIGGVEFTVAGSGPAPGGTRGTIRARGSFDAIALGGQELTLDNINAVPAPGAAALLATAGIAATRRKR